MANKLQLARVLVGFTLGDLVLRANDLVEAAPAVVKEMEQGGMVDSTKEAIAYAKSLDAPLITLAEV